MLMEDRSSEQVSVLHVDTDEAVRERLAETLGQSNDALEIVGTATPDEARQQYDIGEFDCIVSEYEFPETNGLEFLATVRSQSEEVSFLLFTGSGDEAVASRAISAGVTDYVRKNGTEEGVDALVDRVREVTSTRSDGQPASGYDSAQFERFLQAFPDVVFVIDEDGRYVDVIAVGDQSLLYDDVENLLGRRYHDVVPTETADRFLETIQQALETGDQQRIEYQLDVKDGTRWFEARVSPLETEIPQQTVFWIARDITERKRREQEYEQIFNSVNDAICVFDPEDREFVEVNRRYHEMLGYEEFETIKELGIEGLSASDEQYTGKRAWELIREVAASGEPSTVEWCVETSDQQRRWLEATLAPATIGGENYVLSIQRDITERRELEQTYRDIFENVSDGLVVHDADTGEILEVNEQYCELTGYDREELLEKDMRLIVPDDPEYTYEEAIERIRKTRDEGSQLFEFKGERKNGESFVGEINLQKIELLGEERVLESVRDITERKRREQEYEQIFNSVNDIIAVRDPETGEILQVNQAYADLLGYDPGEMRGMSTGDVGVPEDGYDDQQGMEHIREVMTADGPVEFEWKVEDATGQTHQMDVRGTTAIINGTERYLAIGRDITDRKRRERAIETLQTATERLQTAESPDDVAAIAVEAASEMLDLPLGICWFHDADGDRLEPAAATDRTHEADLVSGLGPDRYEYDVFIEGSVTEYTPSDHELDNPLETGVLLPMGDHGLVVVGAHGERTVDGTVLDVANALADHLATALGRVKRAQAVRESERRFRLIAERIDEVIYLAELDLSEALYVNPAYEEIWGRPIDELERDAMAFLDAVDQRDRTDIESGFEAMAEEMRTGEGDESYEFEYRIRQPDGELRWVNGTGYSVDFPGDQRRFVGIVEDITERKRREQRLEVFNRILRHNLRNQLDIIRSHAEVLADRTEDTHAEQIITAVDQLATIGAEARQTDRIMATDKQLTDVSVAELLEEVVEATDTNHDDVRVDTSVPPAANLTANEQALRIAVESALENAVEYADSLVEVSVSERSEGYAIVIADDGPGISSEELVPIEVGSETNLSHGRGLGLWQLRWSVDELNGELSFETTDGTTVRFTVPDQSTSTQRE
jgi:PAS domain S-box-containing protein